MSQTQFNSSFEKAAHAALARYNGRYNNWAYSAVRRAAGIAFCTPFVPTPLYDDPREIECNQFMNLVLDAAFEKCGDPHYHGRVIAACVQAFQADEHLAAVLDVYLCRFDGQGDHHER